MKETPQTLSALFSEEEQSIIHRAIDEDTLTDELLCQILDHPTLTKEEKRNLLINDVVQPYQTRDKYIQHLKTAIDEYKHQFIVSPSTDTTPRVIYTVGCIDRFNGELLYVGNVDLELIGHAFNHMITEFENDGFKDDVGPILMLEDNKTPVRYRFLKRLIKDHTNAFLDAFPALYPDYDPQTPLYIFEVADANNRLPGEEGYDNTFIQYTHVKK